MLERLRATAAVRATVLLAAAVTLSASAGLHAEPVHAVPLALVGARVAAGVQVDGTEGGLHPCLVCLVHAPATAPELPPAVAPATLSTVRTNPASAHPSELTLLPHDDRAPPVLV